jgi:hypothetical protein
MIVPLEADAQVKLGRTAQPNGQLTNSEGLSTVPAYPQVPQYGASPSAGHAGGDYLFEVHSYR